MSLPENKSIREIQDIIQMKISRFEEMKRLLSTVVSLRAR